MTIYPGATKTPMMESNEAGPELGFEYESADDVAGELEVVRGAEDRPAMTQMSREHPRRLDEQVASIKEDLEAAVANHSSI